MVYGDFKSLVRKKVTDNLLLDKAFNIAINPRNDGYQRASVSVVYKSFDKKSGASGSGFKSAVKQVLHKSIISKLKQSVFKTVIGVLM